MVVLSAIDYLKAQRRPRVPISSAVSSFLLLCLILEAAVEKFHVDAPS